MDWRPEEVLALLRSQRHDFLNHLQVVSGYLQLNNREKALNYLKHVFYQQEQVGRLFCFGCPGLALVSMVKLEKAVEKGIVLDLKIHNAMKKTGLGFDYAAKALEACWDAAISLTEPGGELKIDFNSSEGTGILMFKTSSEITGLPPEVVHIKEMRVMGTSVSFCPEKGEIVLYIHPAGANGELVLGD